ncbi:hypothetical protein TRVL_07546 [Trypanosoma vivax]|nr:hypothetical protein TRVL_07546 [Trypanosoma vivax]
MRCESVGNTGAQADERGSDQTSGTTDAAAMKGKGDTRKRESETLRNDDRGQRSKRGLCGGTRAKRTEKMTQRRKNIQYTQRRGGATGDTALALDTMICNKCATGTRNQSRLTRADEAQGRSEDRDETQWINRSGTGR